jgi:hypothetical protein
MKFFDRIYRIDQTNTDKRLAGTLAPPVLILKILLILSKH